MNSNERNTGRSVQDAARQDSAAGDRAYRRPRTVRVGATAKSIRGRWTTRWTDYGSGSYYPY